MIQGRSNELPDFQVFRTVFYYCIMIIVLPVATFFGSKYFVFDGLLNLSATPSNVYSAITSVVSLHIALAAFIIRAYTEADKAKPAKLD